MEALDIIERRINTLSRMLGPVADDNIINGEATKTEDVVDSLLSANALLTEATAQHEQVNKIINRSTELEKYLDPNFIEEHQQVRSKEVYLNAVGPDLLKQCEQLERIKQLEPALGAEYFRNIPSEDLEKLKHITADNGEFVQQCELIEESLILAMKRYGEIQSKLQKSLDAMSKRLEGLQVKIEQKKRAELEKELPIKEN